MKTHPIKTDSRYTIQREHNGTPTSPQFVLRWCNEYIAGFDSYSAAVVRAVGHKAQRDGALTFVEIPAKV